MITSIDYDYTEKKYTTQ
jgi:alpha-tubulin suppressor-like RCC1 family protein